MKLQYLDHTFALLHKIDVIQFIQFKKTDPE